MALLLRFKMVKDLQERLQNAAEPIFTFKLNQENSFDQFEAEFTRVPEKMDANDYCFFIYQYLYGLNGVYM